MICKKCSAKITVEKVHFNTECESCHAWLHSCIQCNLWNSSSQMCISRTTDSVRDREGKNFCEEWQPSTSSTIENKQADNKAKSKFNSLFGK